MPLFVVEKEDDAFTLYRLRRGMPSVCLLCGYSLTGLPGNARCPECGRQYLNDSLLFEMTRPGMHGSENINIGLSWGLFVLFFCGAIASIAFGNFLWTLLSSLIFVLVGAFLIFSFVRYFRDKRIFGNLRVVIDRNGYFRRRRHFSWTKDIELSIGHPSKAIYSLSIGRHFIVHVWLAIPFNSEEILMLRDTLQTWSNHTVIVER